MRPLGLQPVRLRAVRDIAMGFLSKVSPPWPWSWPWPWPWLWVGAPTPVLARAHALAWLPWTAGGRGGVGPRLPPAHARMCVRLSLHARVVAVHMHVPYMACLCVLAGGGGKGLVCTPSHPPSGCTAPRPPPPRTHKRPTRARIHAHTTTDTTRCTGHAPPPPAPGPTQDWSDPSEFFGCGKFTADSWRIFCRGETDGACVRVCGRRPACMLLTGDRMRVVSVRRQALSRAGRRMGE